MAIVILDVNILLRNRIMFDINSLPKSIFDIVKSKSYRIDSIGESQSTVVIFSDLVLKIEKTGPQADREYAVMQWLHGRLPVPEVIAFERMNGFNYFLMSRLDGNTACDYLCEETIENTVIALADGIKQLQQVDISECPYKSTLDKRLNDAKYNIDNDLVDVNDFNDDTLGENGFEDVDSLYNFLVNNQPEEDLVFTLGDYCLVNVFVDGNRATGFIDLGKAGIADKWQDIALCVRSLKYNVCSMLGLSERDYNRLKNLFYSELGINENEEKLRYYILLDELF